MAQVTCSKADLNNPVDAAATVTLLNTYATDLFGGLEPLSDYARENLASELVKRPTAHVFIARVDDQLAGLAICFEGFNTFACQPLLNMHNFAVVPQFRRKGVGGELMMFVESFARSIGCCKLTLEVLQGNLPAQKLYTSCGFGGYESDDINGHALFWQKNLN
ncbi:GNAT family N-acetyltransferase [archaeon]|nr:MAG: GNAT family N-acetyltransferase [archaeon]